MLVYHEVSLSIIFLNVYKIGHRKTRKMLRLRVFGPPRLAPYPEVVGNNKINGQVNCWALPDGTHPGLH